MWTRKPTIIGDRHTPGDYIVLRRGQEVGRVLLAAPLPHGRAYEWNTRTYPCDSGYADDLDDALDQLREAIRARWPDSEESVPVPQDTWHRPSTDAR